MWHFYTCEKVLHIIPFNFPKNLIEFLFLLRATFIKIYFIIIWKSLGNCFEILVNISISQNKHLY